jgi:hypothetical protein
MNGSFHIGDNVAGDKFGGDRVDGNKNQYLSVHAPVREAATRRVILLLSANPRLTSPMQVGEESRAIELAIRLSSHGTRLETRRADSVRRADLEAALLRHEPTVVHFTGHGIAQRGIVVLDGDGGFAQPVPAAALAGLFEILPGKIRCVVLNACFTEHLAAMIGRRIPCVGMKGAISDPAAITFATSFYGGAASGMPVRVAFDLARNALIDKGCSEAEVPVLIDELGFANHTVITD